MIDKNIDQSCVSRRQSPGVSLEEACRLALSAVRITGQETAALTECAGRVLAEDVRARISSPPFRRSAMDGYAVRSADLQDAALEHPVMLPVIGCNDAGTVKVRQIREGQAVRIMTGAVLPDGADAVVKQEETEAFFSEDRDASDISSVLFRKPASPGQCYSPVGEDLAQGERLAYAGDPADAYTLSAAAAAGLTELPVRKKVRAAVICTGDELVPPGMPLTAGKIYGSSHLFLYTRLESLGCIIWKGKGDSSPFAGDDPEEIAGRIRSLADAGVDMIITTGGVSAGRKDYLPEVIRLLGGKVLFHGIDVKPGMPSMLSLVENIPVLSLSGNPYACACIFDLIGRPMIKAMSGSRRTADREGYYPAAQDYDKASPVRRILRAYFDGTYVHFSDKQRNSQMTAGIGCNCMIDISAVAGVSQGEKVRVIMLDP